MTRRTYAPIRRHSREIGQEGGFWRPFDPADRWKFMLAAERLERTRREKGHRYGPLGPIALEVLRELMRIVDFRSGRLEPQILTLCTKLKRSKSAIVGALARLRKAGFLDWIRRWASDDDGIPHQTSNAYRLWLPPAAVRLLGHLARERPPGDDASALHDAAREEELRAMALDGVKQGADRMNQLFPKVDDALIRFGKLRARFAT